MRHVWFCIPCYTGFVHLATFRSLLQALIALTERGIMVSVRSSEGNSMIAHSRSILVAEFLEDESATDLIFIDSDIGFEPEAVMRLLIPKVDIVAGLYPKREEPPDFHVAHLPDGPGEPDGDGLIQVAGVPAGFVKISRKTLQRMVQAYPELRFKDQTIESGYGWALFDNIRDGDIYFGEDYAFCKRWGDLGGKIYIDPEIKLQHIGLKTFEGSWGAWHKERLNGDQS